MRDCKSFPRIFSLSVVLWLLYSTTIYANPVSDITKGSDEYKRITDAIDILKDAGGDPTIKPSPAWLANNIKTYLDAGKIKSRNKPGVFGSNTTEGGPVYIHWNHMILTYPGGFDPKTEAGFKNLVILAQTLAHEKFHSENHGAIGRLTSTNEFESEAYLHEIDFIDKLALALSKKCGTIKSDEPGKKLACYKKLRIIIKSKQDLIRVYNASKFAAAGEPVAEVLKDVIDGVAEQLDLVIPRWEEYAEEADEDTTTLGMLQEQFDQQYGQAQVAFHAMVIDSENHFLAELEQVQIDFTTTIQSAIYGDINALGQVIRSHLGIATDQSFVALLVLDGYEDLLSAAQLYSMVIQYSKDESIILDLNELPTSIDSVVQMPARIAVQIHNSSDKHATTEQLLANKSFSITWFSNNSRLIWLYRYFILGLTIVLIIGVLLFLRRQSGKQHLGIE